MCWERHQVAVIHQEEEGIYCLRKGASVGLVGWESWDLNGEVNGGFYGMNRIRT